MRRGATDPICGMKVDRDTRDHARGRPAHASTSAPSTAPRDSTRPRPQTPPLTRASNLAMILACARPTHRASSSARCRRTRGLPPSGSSACCPTRAGAASSPASCSRHNGRVSWGLTERASAQDSPTASRAPRATARTDPLARPVADERPAGRPRDGFLRRSSGPLEGTIGRSAAPCASGASSRASISASSTRCSRPAGGAAIDERELAPALRRHGVKDALRATTTRRVAAGVFGVPTVVVGDELFWGDDRLRMPRAPTGSNGG